MEVIRGLNMSNEIHLEELLNIMENNSKKNNLIRNNTSHLSIGERL